METVKPRVSMMPSVLRQLRALAEESSARGAGADKKPTVRPSLSIYIAGGPKLIQQLLQGEAYTPSPCPKMAQGLSTGLWGPPTD